MNTRKNPVSSATAQAWTNRDLRLGVFAIFSIWLIAALIWPLSGAVVPWDSKNHFYPMLRYLGAALEHGELPLWNPYHFSGHPAVADPQSLLFTPTMLLFAWLVPQPSMAQFDLLVFAHFLPGAFAFPYLFRRRGWHVAGAVIAAAIFILGGSAAARLQHTGMILSYCWYPLALLLLEETLDRKSYAYALLFAIVAAVMTVGRDQVAFLCALSLIGVVIYHTASAENRLLYLRERIGVLLAAGALGGAILAVPSILTVQFLSTSTRPAFSFAKAATGSLPPDSFATLLFGNIFGSLRWTYDYWGPDYVTFAGKTATDRATNYLFAGTIPALFLLWHGIAGRRLFAREFRFFLILGLVGTVYALGSYTPFFKPLFDYAPGVSLYRRPADATFLINIALAFASGYLVHRYLLEGPPRFAGRLREWRTLLPIAAAVALPAVALASALGYALRSSHLAPALGDVAIGVTIAAAAAMAVAWGSRSLQARAGLAILLVGATSAELVLRNVASSLNAEPRERYAVFAELPPEQLQGLRFLKRELDRRHRRGERPRVEILGLTGAWQNASMVLGLEDTLGYNPLRLADYERAVGPGENAVDPNLRQFPRMFGGYRSRVASLLGLEYLVLDRPIETMPAHFPKVADAEPLYGAGQMWIYQLRQSAPRAYLASRLIPVDSESLLARDELPEFKPGQEALVDRENLEDVSPALRMRQDVGQPAASSVRITQYGADEVTLQIETDKPSLLVLHDIYYPGWEAYVDGVETPIVRTNLLFRGVEVPPGKHTVQFRFQPLSLENLVAAANDLIGGDEDESAAPVIP